MSTARESIPGDYLDLLTDKVAFAHLATKNDDGSLQSTPVWVDYDGTHVIVNTTRKRRKARNMIQRPQVALSIHDPEDPYRYLEIRGTVEQHTEQGAADHIDNMAKKYLGKDEFPFGEPGDTRVMFKIRPEHCTGH